MPKAQCHVPPGRFAQRSGIPARAIILGRLYREVLRLIWKRCRLVTTFTSPSGFVRRRGGESRPTRSVNEFAFAHINFVWGDLK